jgi:tRNA-splicing ligase RtcB
MSPQSNAAPMKSWLIEPLPTDVAQSIERLRHADDVRYLAVMPDVHLASEVCLGVALATSRLVYPAAVGSDIGCGMAAIAFDADAEAIADERSAARVLAGLYRAIPAMKHSREVAPVELPPVLPSAALSDPRLQKLAGRDGRYQLGTLGRGNHFVELQADEQGRLWLMVHSGSRGMGQAITMHHLQRAKADGQTDRLVRFDAESPAGEAYLTDVAWAIAYAEQNRLAMIDAVGRLFGELFEVEVDRGTLIHSNHNHVRQESHDGQLLWVHRKGALSAEAGEPGVIPGSMGSASFHVSGRGEAASLCSSSHGAGRQLSRGEAAKVITARRVEQEMQGVWFDHRQTRSLRDEAPSAYKNIHAVMRAQRELTRIDRQLRPLLSYKGV